MEQIARELGYNDYALFYQKVGEYAFWFFISLIIMAAVYTFIQAILFVANSDGNDKIDD
jgi:hypothetical protein